MNAIQRFFDNESRFGRLMTRTGILIGANLMFVLFCIPIVTIGPAWTALHYTMFLTLKEKEINPFRTFFRAFRDNLKQALLLELIIFALAGILVLELYWCQQFTGPMHYFFYALLMLLTAVVIVGLYVFPVTAVFYGSILQQIRNSVYFSMRNLLNLILILFVSIVPMMLTYLDAQRLPLYSFIWFFIGFSAIAMFTDSRLFPMFLPFLKQAQDVDGLSADENTFRKKSEKEILSDMTKLGM